jgi:hypothetical protein
VERGDTGLGRDAYGQPRRRRPGEHRAYRSRGAVDEAADADGVSDDEYYGQLLRRPDESQPPPRLRQQGRPRLRQPGRFPPPGTGGYPADGPANGGPAGGPGNTGLLGGPGNGGLGNGGLGAAGLGNGGPAGGAGMGGPGNGSFGNGGPAGGPGNGGLGNGARMGGPSGPPRQYWLPNGRRVPPGYDQPYRPQWPGAAGAGNGRVRPGPGPAPGRPAGQDPVGQDPLGDSWSRPGQADGQPPPQGPRGPYGAGRHESREGPGARGAYGIQGGPIQQEPPGPVIRQRETAVPPERPTGAARSVASIAPDGLEAFARDLRALRSKAQLDYPEMAEASHYTMKTLASAAGGLRLPTLPVAVAYVRACGGNVSEWEERWQKLATKLTADAAKKLRDDDELPEPSQAQAIEPPAAPKTPAPEADPAPTEVYVITSAPPRQPGW